MEQPQRDDWLSTLRGIAILLVFCSHLESSKGDALQFILGRIGVVIFFLASGYLAVESRRRRNRTQYIFNRCMRMYPMYWVILIMTVIARNIIQTDKTITLKVLLGNMTLFHQFIGVPQVIGSSWMMPIQVCFFIVIGLFGIDIFVKRFDFKHFNIDMKLLTLAMLMILAIFVGMIRYRTHLPFPTAFFLLIAVSFVGVDFYADKYGGIVSKAMIARLFIFESGLLVATRLSYSDKFVNYIFAYNAGIFLFAVFIHMKPIVKLFSKFSELGFAFFLGAKLPMSIVGYYFDFSASPLLQILGWGVEFVLAVVFAWSLSEYVEKPLLKWAKLIEIKL